MMLPHCTHRRVRNRTIAIAIGLLLALLSNPAASEVEKVSLGHYRNFTFTLDDAAALIKGLNDMLATDIGPGDTRCGSFRYDIKGAPRKYSDSLPHGTVLDPLLFKSSPFTIHIVAKIGDCSGVTSALGCAFTGGPILISKSHARGLVQLYLHEIGHAHGLDHHSSKKNFMYKSPLDTSVGIEDWQCDALKRQPFKLAQAKVEDRLTLNELARALWVHGPPIAEIQALTGDELNQVRQWLSQDDYVYWANSVQILGLRGVGSDVSLMRRVLASKSESPEATNAKVNVPSALGYLAFRTKDAQAFQLLAEMLTPRQNFKYFVGPNTSADDDSIIMALEATKGMAVVAGSGSEAAKRLLAEQALKNQRGLFNLGVDERFFDQMDKLRLSVEKKGLLESLAPK